MTPKNVPLQLNIAPEIRREFHVYAAQNELDVSELFVKIWEQYKANETPLTLEEKLQAIARWTVKIDKRLDALLQLQQGQKERNR